MTQTPTSTRDLSTPAARGGVVLFDGVCNLCNGAVRFIIARDPSGYFRFAPLDSAAAKRLLAEAPAPRLRLPDSMVLVENGLIFTRSAAALRIARRLRFPWPALYALIVLPPPMRNWLYDVVARHRYRWFGKRDSCPVPTPEQSARFLA